MSLDRFIEEIKFLLPEKAIVLDKDILDNYAEDKSTVYSTTPKVVIRAYNKEQVKTVVRLAGKFKVPIVCWGQGSSVTGACLAFSDAVILSFEKMNKILEIDTDNLIAVVEPGVIVADLKKETEKFNLYYPPDPASFESSTIGGNIATGAGGPSAVKYGVTKDYVTGMEVILSNGEEITLGGKIVKKSSGYNLLDLFVTSEGTLGIITKIFLKLVPLPLNRLTIYLTFSNIFSLLQGVNKVLNSSVLPVTLEYIDDTALEFLYHKHNLPDKDKANASLLIEIEYDCEEQKDVLLEKFYSIFDGLDGFINFYPLDNVIKSREIWNARRSIGEVFRENFHHIEKADIVVPRGRIFNVIKEIKDLSENFGIKVSCFGHAGDGNIHVNFLFDKECDSGNILEETFQIVKNNNGLPSGEHGIGKVKKKFLKDFIGEEQINIMRKIKRIFDPENLLNPDKIFD